MTKQSDEIEIKPLPGPIRRNLPLLVGIGLAFLVGPMFNNILDQYRMVVLDKRGDTMFVARANQQPPEWIDATDAKPGAILAKELGQWSPVEVKSGPEDAYILELYQRYTSSWHGRVVRINVRTSPQGAETAVVELVGGGETSFPIWSDHLASLTKGSVLRKVAGEWDPVIVDPSEPLPAGFQMNAVPEEAKKAEADASAE